MFKARGAQRGGRNGGAPGFRVSHCSPGMTGLSFSSFQRKLESRCIRQGLLSAYFFAFRSRILRITAPSELTIMKPPSTTINIVLKSMSLPPSSGCSSLVCQGFFLGLLLHNMKPPATAVAARIMTTHTTGSRSIKPSFVLSDATIA